jgi:hypothetical protein
VQQIHINRNRVNSIEFDNPEITVPLKPGDECSFEISIINYGYPTHVYLSVSESLKDNVTFLHDNPYIANQEWIPIVVTLPANTKQARGKIKVTTGYGSHSETFNMFIGVQQASFRLKPVIEIDEGLGTPGSYNRSMQTKINRYSKLIRNYFKIPKTEAFRITYSNILLLLIVFVVTIVIVLIIFALWKINALYGAIVISSFVIILTAYVILHSLFKE